MNLTTLLTLLLAASERVVPMFIHNPKSQAIEAIVFGVAEEAVSASAAAAKATVATPAAPAAQ